MKKIFLSAMFLALSTYAIPTPQNFSGVYEFSSPLQPSGVTYREIVHTLNSAGHQRVAELKQDGYTCVVKTSTQSVCKKSTKNEIPADIVTKLKEQTPVTVTFSEPISQWSLDNSADDLTEYSILQKTFVSEKIYKKIRYLILPGVEKIAIEDEENRAPATWLVVEGTKLKLMVSYHKTISNTRLESYFAEASFTK